MAVAIYRGELFAFNNGAVCVCLTHRCESFLLQYFGTQKKAVENNGRHIMGGAMIENELFSCDIYFVCCRHPMRSMVNLIRRNTHFFRSRTSKFKDMMRKLIFLDTCMRLRLC